jgi:hypothetical protein
VPGHEILSDVNKFFGSSYRDPENPSNMPAINYGPLAPYKDNWGCSTRRSGEQGVKADAPHRLALALAGRASACHITSHRRMRSWNGASFPTSKAGSSESWRKFRVLRNKRFSVVSLLNLMPSSVGRLRPYSCGLAAIAFLCPGTDRSTSRTRCVSERWQGHAVWSSTRVRTGPPLPRSF